MAIAEKSNSVKGRLQKELERVIRALKEKNVLVKSTQEAAKVRKLDKKKQDRRPRKTVKRRRYEFCAQECLYGFARVAYN